MFRSRFTSAALIFLIVFAFFAPMQEVFAQTLTPADEARLKVELAQVEAEQKAAEVTLAGAQQQTASLQRDILILNTKIKAAQLNIRAKNLLIESLGKDISQKQDYIGSLEARIDRGRESLAQIMRKTRETGSLSLPELLLSRSTLTDTLSDLDTFESVQTSLKTTFELIRQDKATTENERDALDRRKNQETDARIAIEQDKKNIQKNEADKQTLLSISKDQEKTYSQILAEKQKRAADIRAALFSLRDAKAIPFADALAYANLASKSTGVRPAFLLAILTQESSLGKNVGSCYLTNKDTGSGVNANSGAMVMKVMKPDRDVQPFLDITSALGLNPLNTLVSCPQSVGWGGAMGPSQFIASTWVLFKDRIANALSISTPNPWNPRDAFMASAIYLGDLGALGGSYTGERNAACKYYSGSSCSKSALIKSYGTSVMSHADTIQRTMIDPLQGI
ncbi:hypothetical protein EB052_00425 [bacterium]|nr:hypothetical protein [bacterium]